MTEHRIGGYTLEQLLGSAPVLDKKNKRGVASRIFGAPFKLVGALIKLPVVAASRLAGGFANAIVEIFRLPLRLVGAIIKPWRRS